MRVSPQHAPELTPALLAAGVEILVVHGTIISAEHVVRGEEEPLNLKTFIADLDIPVIAGGVYDYSTATHLMRAGVAGVIVGSGHTSTVVQVPMPASSSSSASGARAFTRSTDGAALSAW